MNRRFAVALRMGFLVMIAGPGPVLVEADEAGVEFFEKEIRPILAERCLKCHGDEKPKGGLRLTSREAVLAGGDTGPSAVAGRPVESPIVEAIRYEGEPRMPPAGKLDDREIAALARWVEIGLPWPEAPAQPAATTSADPAEAVSRDFWSFRPIANPTPPSVRDASWPRGELDRFLLAALEAKGLRPAEEADRGTLIRRASFDLTGLPPSPEEIAAFLADDRPDAYERVVDRLLASPAHGERWARHWLDVVRYADSLDSRGVGSPGDILDAWRYRDWVVNSLNADMPYDRFLKYQVAGDLLPPADESEGSDGFNRQGTIATSMLAIGNWGNGDADKEKVLTDIVDDQIDVVTKAFLGLTVACARCHDHKFDPIPTRDYYGLAGIFASTHILPKVNPKGEGEGILRVALDTPGDTRRRREYADRLAALEAEAKAVEATEYAAFAAAQQPLGARYLLALWEYRNRPADQEAIGLEEFAAARGLLPFVLRQWSEPSNPGRVTSLSRKVEAVRGDPTLKAWNGPEGSASATANLGDQPRQIATFRLPPRSISVHPGPSSGVAISWTSPISGTVRVGGSVGDSDPVGGDGVLWFVDHLTIAGGCELASGNLPNGGGAALARGEGGDNLASVAVRRGDRLQLVIMPKGEYSFDTTTTDLTISSWEDASSWDLTRDVLDDFLAGNPHADRLGHQGVWRFEDLGTTDRPSPSTTAPDSPLETWRAALLANDPARIREAADGLAASIRPDDPNSPFGIRSRDDEEALPSESRDRLAAVRARLEAHRSAPPPPIAYANAAQEGGVPGSSQAGLHDVKVHIRGRYDRLGDPVPRHFPTVLGGEPDAGITEGSGRRELAEWLARPENPLTSRVIVNRLWQGHFGEGIVRTASNFGMLGDRPSHPELLDYLARRLIANGWSLKAVHREIMMSAAYRQSSTPRPETLEADADNRLFGRMNRRRLEAEALRDSLLSASGRLDRLMGGPADRDFNGPRRGLYVMTIRSDRSTFGALFDQADPTASVDHRAVTTVAPQSLFMLNNPFVLDASRGLADRVIREVPEDGPRRLERAYLLLFGRPPIEAERAIAGRYLDREASRGTSAAEALERLAHILFCANEFLYID